MKSKWLVVVQDSVYNFKERYNNNKNDLSGDMLNEMFYRILNVTDLNSCSQKYGGFNRGARTGYVLLSFGLTFFGTANQAPPQVQLQSAAMPTSFRR